MIRDRDSIYGKEFRRRVKSCGTRCLITPPRSPKANAICERLNGTLRRDCLDHIIVIDDVHADRVLKEYVRYYHGRPHRGLCMQPPIGARWSPPVQRVPPRTLLLGQSSAGSITSTTLGFPETDDRRHTSWKRRSRHSSVPDPLPRVRPPDLGAVWPKSGAAQPSPRPILVAAFDGIRSSIGIISADRLTNELLEGINSLIQSAKARARGFRSASKMKTIIYLLLSKLDFRLPCALPNAVHSR
jgi:hypothetical protein